MRRIFVHITQQYLASKSLTVVAPCESYSTCLQLMEVLDQNLPNLEIKLLVPSALSNDSHNLTIFLESALTGSLKSISFYEEGDQLSEHCSDIYALILGAEPPLTFGGVNRSLQFLNQHQEYSALSPIKIGSHSCIIDAFEDIPFSGLSHSECLLRRVDPVLSNWRRWGSFSYANSALAGLPIILRVSGVKFTLTRLNSDFGRGLEMYLQNPGDLYAVGTWFRTRSNNLQRQDRWADQCYEFPNKEGEKFISILNELKIYSDRNGAVVEGLKQLQAVDGGKRAVKTSKPFFMQTSLRQPSLNLDQVHTLQSLNSPTISRTEEYVLRKLRRTARVISKIPFFGTFTKRVLRRLA